MSPSRLAAAKLQGSEAAMNRSPLPLYPIGLGRICAFVLSILGRISLHRSKRLLHLCETLSLGEKRLLAIVKVENQRYLIAATGQEISLLQRLPDVSANTASSAESSANGCNEGLL